jgi:hypothetical protein
VLEPQIAPSVEVFRIVLTAFRDADDPAGGIAEVTALASAEKDYSWMLSRGPIGCQMVECYLDANMVRHTWDRSRRVRGVRCAVPCGPVAGVCCLRGLERQCAMASPA